MLLSRSHALGRVRNIGWFSNSGRTKTWTTYGKLTADKREIYFCADQRLNVDKLIIPSVKQDSFVLLHGPRASGKSTLCDVATSRLSEEFTVLFVDFQRVRLNKGEDVFWESFGRELTRNYDFLPLVINQSDFIDTFTKKNWEKMSLISPDKPVVMIIDEFDKLYTFSDSSTQDSILSALRSIKQDKNDYILKSFIGIGTFSILKLTGGSLFAVRDTMQCPTLSKEQVESLFEEYANDRKKTIDPSVISDIYYRSDGHAGSISFLGKLIDEGQDICNENEITIGAWQNIVASRNFQNKLLRWVPMEKMIDTLSLPYQIATSNNYNLPLIKEANNVLFKYFLPSDLPITPTGALKRYQFELLASEGAISYCGNNFFKVHR